MQTHSYSANQAKAILGAWHSGDRSHLTEELARVNGLQSMDSGEQERLELLSAIAVELRGTDPAAPDAACGALLEHLAFSRRRAIRSSEYGRAAAAAALQ